MNDGSWKRLINEMPLGFVLLGLIRKDDGSFTDTELLEGNYFFSNVYFKGSSSLMGNKLSSIKSEDSGIVDILQPIVIDYINDNKKECECLDHKSGKYFRTRVFEVENDLIGVFFKEISYEKELKSKQHPSADSTENFYTFFNSVSDMLFILDHSGNIEYANRTVFDRLGYSEAELYGRSVLNIHPEHRRQEALLNVQEMLAGERKHCPIPVITKSGVVIPVETRVTDGIWNGQKVLFGVSKDLSELKKSEEKILQSLSQ